MVTPRSRGPAFPGAPRVPRIRIFLPGTELRRRFDVVEVLGSGASGVVYAVVEKETGRELALKVFRQERLSEHAVARLRRELDIVRASGSPRFVAVEELGRSGDVLYATEERVPGATLRQRLAEGPLPVPEALRVTAGVLQALVELHGLGILHRDLKPGNVFLLPDGGIRLADFGLGRTWEREDSPEASIDYLSPEQVTGGHVDAPSDLYSVGVLLFEMLTGRPPLHGGSSLGTAVAHLKEPAPGLRTLRPDLPEWLERIVRRLLAKDAAERYGSAREVLEDLGRQRARSPRRRRLPERAWLGVLVALACGLAALAWHSFANPRFARLVFDDEAGLRALDGDGRLLWRRADLSRAQDAWPVRVNGRAPDQVAALLTRGHETDPNYNRFLILLDADTGEVAAGVFLPDLASALPPLPNAYRASLAAADLSGSGRDDLLVTYDNVRGAGSYTLLYDPRKNEARPLFVSTGSQAFLGVADVDGDGRNEVLLSSVNEAMGGAAAVAAVRVPVKSPPDLGNEALAASPDRDHPRGIAGLSFYALLPTASLPLAGRVEEEWHAVELERPEGGRLVLGFDGFLRTDRAPGSPGDRAAARARAYDRLREAARLLAGGFGENALPLLQEALADVRGAGDRALAEWTLRLRVRALAQAGRLGEAETELSRIAERSDLVVPVALDGARAFHLAGDLSGAVRWYRRGLAALRGNVPVSHPEELLEGLVLALGETHRWDLAVEGVDDAALADPVRFGALRTLRAYALFRATGRADREVPAAEGTELSRALAFELRAAAGEPAEPLIAEVSAEIPRVRATRPLLESLRGVLLARAGRFEEAVAQARVAFSAMRLAAGRHVEAHANVHLASSRYALVLREARRAVSQGPARFRGR